MFKKELPYWARIKGLTPEEYDAELYRTGGNFFDSQGNYIELDPPKDDSNGVFAAKSLALIIILLAKLAFWGAIIIGGLYGFGLWMDWW